ncbi:UvrD-helicase domain-containing protein [Roseobacter sp. TSBP12]|uniref:UvrD-helicase domain-containing protein n=1 Tax=Roseobacter sp. TSBP12 TaxID=1236613 RepID=UPI00125FF5CD|nr:UvrD-helicase domain-containing protein [Roseobacter sp. TSBP12]KAB6716434.1 DNA helicase II [Roseobacter sp. TSBP12]
MIAAVSPAVQAAQAAQARVSECLDAGQNFRLEAGAGAGKTFSLVEALKKIIAERGPTLIRAGQKFACITYTEVARKEIAQDIEDHPAILVNTIHGFAWSFLTQHQKALRELVIGLESERELEAIAAGGGVKDQIVDYNLGFFGIDDKRITLHHDHVPKFFAKLLAKEKSRRLFTDLYPVLFIDEYQDTDPHVMSAISEHFFTAGEGPIIGLFGDHWQTIYRNDFELTNFPDVIGIDKGANFRSVPAVVNVLNKLRPGLPQAVRDPKAPGEARFFHCNDFKGARRDDSPHKLDLPATDHSAVVERLKEHLTADGWDFAPKRTKVLMLTHNAIAAKQGYPRLAKVFKYNDAFAKKEDAVIAFFADVVEPLCEAYEAKRFGNMFAHLGRAPTIRSLDDKASWVKDLDKLVELRLNGTIGDVIDFLRDSARPRLTDRIMEREDEIKKLGPEPTDGESNTLKNHRALRSVPYAELIEVNRFVSGHTPFATQHSVKGAQFENVLVVLSGGWAHYNWHRFLDQLHTGAIGPKEEGGFYRARNLFYVAISRPETRLAVLATQTLSPAALSAVSHLFEPGNVSAIPFPN